MKKNAKVNALVEAFLQQVTDADVQARFIVELETATKKLPELGPVVSRLKAMREKLGLGREAVVTTVLPLEPGQRKTIKAELEKKFAMPVTLSEQMDVRLIGGMKILSGDWLYDDSVAGTLKRLNKALKA